LRSRSLGTRTGQSMGCFRRVLLPLLAAAFAFAADDPDGTTPLHWAVRSDDLKSVQSLLHSGANPNAANRYGVTPLSLAATNGDAAMVEALLKAGADAKSSLAIMTAARAGNPKVVSLLLEHGADANASEAQFGETALMWAAADNHGAAIKI